MLSKVLLHVPSDDFVLMSRTLKICVGLVVGSVFVALFVLSLRPDVRPITPNDELVVGANHLELDKGTYTIWWHYACQVEVPPEDKDVHFAAKSTGGTVTVTDPKYPVSVFTQEQTCLWPIGVLDLSKSGHVELVIKPRKRYDTKYGPVILPGNPTRHP